MHVIQHEINSVKCKANLASSCIFLWVGSKMGFIEALVDKSIKNALLGGERIQKQRRPWITERTIVACYCYYHIPENTEDFPAYGNIKILQKNSEDIFSSKSSP